MPNPSSVTGPPTIPSYVPHVIKPPGGVIPVQPQNTTLIQIGFNQSLNYDFVVANTLSQSQIFEFLPEGIAFGLNVPITNVTMQILVPYDTTQEGLDYVPTLALAYVPSDMVDSLGLDLHVPPSNFYNNPDVAVRTLVSAINPAFPILAGGKLGGANGISYTGSSPSSTATSTVDDGAPLGSGSGNSAPVNGTSVGIGVGVVCGAAAYGAAMFFVARRYKKRRQTHYRSPSLLNSPVMSQGPHDFMGGAHTALMSGGRGDSSRSMSPLGYGLRDSRGSGGSGSGSTVRQQISAPVMAENSLGWN